MCLAGLLDDSSWVREWLYRLCLTYCDGVCSIIQKDHTVVCERRPVGVKHQQESRNSNNITKHPACAD